MKTTVLAPRGEQDKAVRAMRREAQIAYEASSVRTAGYENDDLGPVLRARRIDTGCGPALHLSAAEDRPGSTMFLLSAALLRKLLTAARMARPRGADGRRWRRRLDIRV